MLKILSFKNNNIKILKKPFSLIFIHTVREQNCTPEIGDFYKNFFAKGPF